MKAVITGGSKGIGKAIAKKFLENGYHVQICSRTESQLKETAEEFHSQFPNSTIEYFVADLSLRDEVKKFAKWILKKGHVDVLVNNAGVYLPGNCYDEPEGNIEQLMAINFYSAYDLSRLLLPSMIHHRTGHIFNICSIASLQAYEGGGGYSISKYALKGLTDNLRHEMKSFGIKVTGVYAGAVNTDSWKNFDNSNGRIMEPGDIASMVFAASQLTPQAVVEEILFRPQLGDL